MPFAALVVLAISVATVTPGRAAADDHFDFNRPVAKTGEATAIGATAATLNGAVGTNGRATRWWFEYGPTTAYGAKTPPADLAAGYGGPVAATVTDLAPATQYHFRLVAVHPGRAFELDFGADHTFTTTPAAAALIPATPAAPAALTPAAAAQTAPPAATLGTTAVVAPVSGTVGVKVPGAAAFAPLGANGEVPVGAILDTRKGRVALTTALDGGRTQTATFERGVFQVRQSKTGHGLTDIYLRGPAPACGTSARAAAQTKRKPPRRRQLWGRDRGGRYRTHGNNSVATVRGTSWITTDTCSGTRTTVKAGAVSVRDIGRHRTVLVRAGHSYLAPRR